MARMTFSSKWGRVAVSKKPLAAEGRKSAEQTVREIKSAAKAEKGEDYRERSISIHGLVCARCGRDFSATNRHLLTVHHKDGNHHNNPQDGSNWENLCVYCHEDVHSREGLSEYLGDHAKSKEVSLVYEDAVFADSGSEGLLAQKLKDALQKKK
ncbi:MAG TPA: YajD family HNH nuclease [Smithellaceae bacterium]|nr:YajD family HNH nuclease [Smithellaceae bacterium]HQM45673.1 YajD family HNH nuclease [Smithellaceae bacterium]